MSLANLSPRSKALAFRIWAYCKPLEWDCTIAEIAEALVEKPQRIATVMRHAGWSQRIRTPQRNTARTWAAFKQSELEGRGFFNGGFI